MDKTTTIAIIDDDKIYHVLTRRIIESSNVADKILEFYDGQEALVYMLENQNSPENLPDLIFLDIQMPFVDGWQFLDQYVNLEMPKPITVYIVSSSISSLDHDKSRQYKVIKNFLIKPFNRDKVLDVLNEFKIHP
jgi:CheY-like chemotaxis protein